MISARKNCRYLSYFIVEYKDGKRTKQSIAHKENLISRLARKAYLEQEIKILDEEINWLNDAIKHFPEPDYLTVLKKLPAHFECLPKEYLKVPYYSNSTNSLGMQPSTDSSVTVKEASLSVASLSPAEWGCSPYRQNGKFADSKSVRLSCGIEVRTKGEGSIVEEYIQRGIPFHYDETISINGTWISPDIIAIRPDGKLIYHEHCGLMSNADYLENYNNKLALYQSAGIVPWDNLILTYERGNGVLDMELIRAQMDSFFRS